MIDISPEKRAIFRKVIGFIRVFRIFSGQFYHKGRCCFHCYFVEKNRIHAFMRSFIAKQKKLVTPVFKVLLLLVNTCSITINR